MAEIKNHSLDGSNEEAVKKIRQLIKDYKREKKNKKRKNK